MKITKPDWTFYQNENKVKVIMSFDATAKKIDGKYLEFIKESVNELLEHYTDNSDCDSEGNHYELNISDIENGCIAISVDELPGTISEATMQPLEPIDLASAIIRGDYNLNELREISEHLISYCDCKESGLPFEDVEQ